MGKYKAVLFDLDGTLLDTTEGVIAAVKKTILKEGFAMPEDAVLKTFVGPPMQKTMGEIFHLDPEAALRVANEFRSAYKDSLFQAELYDGVIELLEKLHNAGMKIAVATNKSHQNAMAILERFGIKQFCDYAQGTDLEGKLSKINILEKCIEAIGCARSETVLVGDSIFDLHGAEQAGLDFVAVTYGFGFKIGEQLESKCVVSCKDNVYQLSDVLF